MIDKSSLLKSKGRLYLEFIPKDGLFHKMLLLSLMGFLTGWCNQWYTIFCSRTICRNNGSNGMALKTTTNNVPLNSQYPECKQILYF